MIVTDNDNIVTFDVDETLVMWSWPQKYDGLSITFNNFGYAAQLLPHDKHIELLKQFKARGHYVIVWSQGGYQWAREVVKVLGIEKYVDLVMTKPKWIVDDLPAAAWTKRSYLDLNGKRMPCKDVELVVWEDENIKPNDQE